MTKNEVLVMLADGGLAGKFTEADKAHEIVHGTRPDAYVAPQWLYDVLKALQSDRPQWSGRNVDPWNKDEIRGQ